MKAIIKESFEYRRQRATYENVGVQLQVNMLRSNNILDISEEPARSGDRCNIGTGHTHTHTHTNAHSYEY